MYIHVRTCYCHLSCTCRAGVMYLAMPTATSSIYSMFLSAIEVTPGPVHYKIHIHVHVQYKSDARYKANTFAFSCKRIRLLVINPFNYVHVFVKVCLPPLATGCKLHEPYTLHLICTVYTLYLYIIYIYIRTCTCTCTCTCTYRQEKCFH